MRTADVRAQLEAIAAGTLTRSSGADIVSTGVIEKHGNDFRAWATFADNKGREPLSAPTALLTPLP